MMEFNGKDRKTIVKLLHRITLLEGQDQRNRAVNLAKGAAVKSVVSAGGTFTASLAQVKTRLKECLDMRDS